ncbi:21163_t:CDS:2, partial [Racocetra persica]
MAHVYYRHYFANKIIYDVKRDIVHKILQIQGNYEEKEALNVLTYDLRNFADMVVFVPNQIFLLILSAIYTFIGLNKARDNDLLFQKQLEKQTKKENALINNRNLIIKKGLFFTFRKEYQPIVAKTRKRLNEFLAREERNDIQNNLIIKEPITVISFQEGQLNYLTGANGF